MRIIFKYLRPYYLRMFGGLIIKVSGTLCELGLPYILAYIIDTVIPLNNISKVLLWGVVMLLLAWAGKKLNIMANRFASAVARDTVRTLRHDLYEKITSLSGSQMDYFTVPSLVSRMTSDTYNVHQIICMMQRIGVRAPIIIIGGVILSFKLEPVLTLILVGTLPLIILVVIVVSKLGIPLFKKAQGYNDKMIKVVRENITGVRVIKALSKGESEQERFEEANAIAIEGERKASSVMAIISPSLNLILNLGLTLVIIVGAFRVNMGLTKIGEIIAFQSYFTIILNAMMMVNRIFVNYSQASASGGRIEEVLNAPEELKIEEQKDISVEDSKYHIVFNDVSFSYIKKADEEKEEDYNIKNISFKLQKGESLGIIGSTGSGKTTIINLLMRFYDVDKGEIRINGRNIKTIPFAELRNTFGTVFQNDILFQGNIKENIDFYRGINDEKLKEAAENAQAMEFIDKMSNGIEEYTASKGSNFSGGQKQRILLARAIAGDASIIVLDDSSSALDYKTDSLLRGALAKNYQDATKIIIAQRINSVCNLDNIMVLEDGEIKGFGKHEELLLNCQVYKEIYDSQMGGDDIGR